MKHSLNLPNVVAARFLCFSLLWPLVTDVSYSQENATSVTAEASQLESDTSGHAVTAVEVLTASSRIDWQQKSVTLSASLPQSASDGRLQVIVTAPPYEDTDGQLVTVSGISNGHLELTGTTSQFLLSLAPGTRSLWMTGDTSRRYRIDLPTPNLMTAKSEPGDHDKGPSLNLTVAGLLPGFQVLHATQPEAVSGEAAQWKSSESPVITAGIGYPRIADVIAAADPEMAVISLRFGHRSDQATPLHHFLTVMNPDGSQTRTVRLTQQGVRFTSDVIFTRDGRSLPIDQEVTVPSVELMDVGEAKKQVTAAGMIPILFDINSLQEVQEADNQIVLTQGLSGGTKSRTGECLLLAVRVSAEPENQGMLIAQSDIMLDPVGPLSLVDISENPLGIIGAAANPGLNVPSDGNFVPPTNDGTSGSMDVTPGLGVTGQASEIPGPDELVSEISEAGVGELPSSLISDATIGVNPNPGVNLDPTTTPDQTVLTGTLKVVLDAILQRVQQGDAPGILGSAIADVTKLGEQSTTPPVGGEVLTLQAADVLKTLTDRLGLQLTAAQSQEATKALQNYIQGRVQASGDHDGRVVAAEVAVWMIAWLYRQGFYDPATNLQISGNGLGKPVVVLTGKPIDPAWLKQVEVVNGSIKATSVGSGKTEISEIKIEESELRISIPAGKELVKVSSQPSHIRVPGDMKDKSADQALARLRQAGLKPAADGKIVSTDKVVDTDPLAGKWVRPDEAVKLTVLRRVPGLKESTAKAAKAKLTDFELVGKTEGDVRADDIVSDQRPPEGEYVARGTEVQVVFKRRVPNIEGQTITEADRLLTDAGFKTQHPDDIRFLASDVVLQQKPPAEVKGQPVYGNPEAVIKYVRVGTRMPDLAGSQLGKAKTLPEAKKLLESMQLDFKLAGPETNLATARVLEQSPKAGELIDRANATVQFSVVVPVPSLPPRMLVRVAQERLEQHDLNDDVSVGPVLEDDVVLNHTIAGRVHTEGTDKFVPPGTKVTLNVGRIVPRLDQVAWRTGIAMLQKAGLKSQLPEGYAAGEFVHHTAPAGGELIDIRKPVTVFPGVQVPDVRKQELAEAQRVIRDAGLNSRLGRTVEAESDDLQGRSEVQNQSPIDGIVLKSPSTTITLDVTRYVMASIKVPQLVNQRRQNAEEILVARGLELKVRTIRTVPTTDPKMAGVEIVNSQDPASGIAVARNSVVQVGVTRYVGVTPPDPGTPAAGFVTYARSPAYPNDDQYFQDFVFLKCTLAADRKSVTIETLKRGSRESVEKAQLNTSSSARRDAAGNLVIEVSYQTVPFGEHQITLSFPESGNGDGTISAGSDARGRAIFSTQRPGTSELDDNIVVPDVTE